MPDSSPRLLKPALYARAADGEPVLLGGRCECGHIFFPMQTFGCEQCGRSGNSLQPMALRARGTLRASATVHVHADETRPAPFVVGMIALEEGPVIRTVLVDARADHDAPGTQVEAVLIPINSTNAETTLDLRFRPVQP